MYAVDGVQESVVEPITPTPGREIQLDARGGVVMYGTVGAMGRAIATTHLIGNHV